MNCKNCGHEISDNMSFCQNCGTKNEDLNSEKFCSGCGTVIKNDSNFCPKCGKNLVIKISDTDITPVAGKRALRASKSIWFTAISAFVCLIIRLTAQQTYYSLSDFVDNRKVVGLDDNIKPFITAIPIITLIIAVLMIVNNKTDEKQKKTTALIINIILFSVALLFIWFDIPYSIIDF